MARQRESLLLPGFSPLQTITYWNLGMHLMYIQQSFVFFSNSPPPAFHGAQPIPHFPSSPTFSTSCYFQRQAAVKSPLLCLSNTWIFWEIQAVQISSFSFPICSPFFSSAKVNRMCTEFLSTIVRLIKELGQLYLYNSQIFIPVFMSVCIFLILILCLAFFASKYFLENRTRRTAPGKCRRHIYSLSPNQSSHYLLANNLVSRIIKPARNLH